MLSFDTLRMLSFDTLRMLSFDALRMLAWVKKYPVVNSKLDYRRSIGNRHGDCRRCNDA